MTLQIRPATSADLDALESIEAEVFEGDRLSRRSFRYYLARAGWIIVAQSGGNIAGYALIASRKGSDAARLYSIAIRPSFKGGGLGKQLLAAAETAARARGCARMRLEVREDNGPAIALYRRSGYAPFGRYPDYYEDAMAALRFEKALG